MDDLRAADAAWQADPLPHVEAEWTSTVVTDWQAGAPSIFDVSHDRTARFYATNRGVSPCFFEREEPEGLVSHIPMGYTVLELYEKRGVVADGALVRAWPRRFGSVHDFPSTFQLVLPRDGERGMLILGASHPLPSALRDAENLSARDRAAGRRRTPPQPGVLALSTTPVTTQRSARGACFPSSSAEGPAFLRRALRGLLSFAER